MRSILLCTLILAAGAAMGRAQDSASVPAADGFQCPVGPNGTGEGYYIARGYRANGHLGDDWNGVKGGDTDMGDPVYATAHGIVVFAKNYHVGWGNVVIIRHAYYEGLSLRYVDSLYGHLADFNVREGQEVKRGQRIGHIGNNNGMYDAHLHFEIRKNINIGMFRSSFPRDGTNYYEPNQFVAAHLSCSQGGKTVSVPINTFPATAPPSYVAAKVYTPVYSPGSAPASHRPPEGAGSLRLSREPEHKTAPAPKVVTVPPPTPKPTAPPAPVVETPTTASSTKNSLPPVASRDSAAPALIKKESTPTPAPAPKSSKTASTKTPSETPSPKKESAKESATGSTKESSTASTKKGATPAPASKSGTTASAKASSTPSPKTASTATSKTTTTTATKPTPTPAKASTTASEKKPSAPPARETATAKAVTPEPAPQKTARVEPKPSILDVNNHEPPPPPAPAEGSPIRRSVPGFRVDRFQDLRGMGY